MDEEEEEEEEEALQGHQLSRSMNKISTMFTWTCKFETILLPALSDQPGGLIG